MGVSTLLEVYTTTYEVVLQTKSNLTDPSSKSVLAW